MNDRDTIIAAYEAKEAEAGGVAHCDVRRLLETTADDLSLPFETVVDVMREHFAGAVN